MAGSINEKWGFIGTWTVGAIFQTLGILYGIFFIKERKVCNRYEQSFVTKGSSSKQSSWCFRKFKFRHKLMVPRSQP